MPTMQANTPSAIAEQHRVDCKEPLSATTRELRYNQPSTKHNILNLFTEQITEGRDERTLIFDDVNEMTAEGVIEELDRVESVVKRISYNSVLESLKIVVIPNKVHECHMPWLVDDIKMYPQPLTFSAKRELRILASPRYDGFLAPYTSSRKEPDACILPERMLKPTLVVESGWSESRTSLHRDRDVWLIGAATTTEVVLILKWSQLISKKVTGDVEVWARDIVGAPCLLQQEVVFPKPPPQTAASQIVKINRRQLFGQTVGNGNADVSLTVDHLREIADEYIRSEGYTPA